MPEKTQEQLMVERLEEQMKNPMPTPMVGTRIWWFEGTDHEMKTPFCADVVRQLEVGKVSVAVQKYRSVVIHKDCYWAGHEIHKRAGGRDSATIMQGRWMYMPGYKPPQADFEFHMTRLKKQLDQAYRHMKTQKELKQRLAEQTMLPEASSTK